MMAADEEEGLSEIIDRIYDVAVDPERYEEMLDRWEQRLARQRIAAEREGSLIDEAGIAPHLRRADVILNQVFQGEDGSRKSGLEAEITVAFLVAADMVVVNANRIADRALGIAAGDPLRKLPLHRDDLGILWAGLLKLFRSPAPAPVLFRFNLAGSDRSTIFHATRLHAAERPTVLVRTTELGWPDHLDAALRDAFSLSSAELEIVRAMAEGKSLREIAQARGRSYTTVRSQIGAVLAKTETHSQAELMRMTLGLMEVLEGAPGAAPTPDARGLQPLPFQTLFLRDGRRSDWIEFGAPAGRVCLYLPLDYGLTRWPLRAEREAERRNIRVVVPIRAGFGQSSPQPPVDDYTEATADDMAQLLNRLRIKRCAVLALGADLRFAVALANRTPGLVSGILGCSADLPIATMEQYQRMHKWHRFALANARYAPKILPFVLKAGFALAWRMGKEAFFRHVNADSPADIATYADPEVKEAILLGSEVALSATHSAHAAVARECIDSERDWGFRIHACDIPIRLLQGTQDPQARPDTVRELAQEFTRLDIEFVEDAGQLLFFQLWPRALDELGRFLPKH